MAGNNKPSDIPQPQDDTVYRVKHISRSAWEDGTLNLPGLTPKAPVREEEPELDDVIMDMAMTGEIPLELIRSMLRKQEEQLRADKITPVKGPTGGDIIRPAEIRPAAVEAAAAAPTPEEIEQAKGELRAMKAKSRLPQAEYADKSAAEESAEESARKPRRAKRRKEAGPKLARRKEKYGEPAEEDMIEEPAGEEEAGGPELLGATGLLSRVREGGPGFWDDAVPLYHIPLQGVLRAIYRSLYYYGLRFVRPLRIAGRTVLPILATPLLTLWHLLRALAIAAHHITIGRALRALEAVRETHARRLSVRKGRVHLRTILRGILVDYRPVLRPAANVLMPLAALMVLLLMIQGVFSATYALEVTYDGAVLGNVVNKSVFEQALAAADNNIVPRPETAEAPAGEEDGESEKIDQARSAQYKIARINPEDIKSANDLTDQLLAAQGDKTSAYGLYIDDKLFAPIKNSTDADIVLDNIKKTKAAELHVSESASVAFVQKVDLVPGRYLVEQLVDAQTLLERLSKPQREEKTVEVQAGDNPYSLVSRYQLSSVNELYALNPWMQEEGAKLHVGDPVKVRGELTRLEVKIIQIETRMEEVPYETRDTDNYNLFRGEIRIRVKGVPGKDKVTERVTYIDGVRFGQPEIISRSRETEPVAERREIGQKNPVVTLPSGDTVKIAPSTSGFVWPVPACHRISSPYGYRGRSFHKGIDIADGSTNGKVIVAAKSGVVEQIQLGGTSYGNMILINHGNGVKTRYAHIMTNSISVRQGETVSIGQPIARVGSTGNSTGPHLHFEVIVNGSTQNPTNYVKP